LSEDSHESILVHEGDSAESLARQFCKDQGLQDEMVQPLTAHIAENVRRLGLPMPTAKAAVRPVQRRPCKASQAGRPEVGTATSTPRSDVRSLDATPTQRRSIPRGTPRQLNVVPPPEDAIPSEGIAPTDGGNPRFLQLFQDSVQKKFRLHRLKQQVERDQEQRVQAGTQVAPGTTRYAAWHRRSERAALGERLYNDAAKRALKMRHLQEMQEEERRLQEQQETTFKPAIEVSQRRCQGTSRSLQDPEGLKKRMKMERLRNMQEKAELDGCTFKPEIDQKSEELISQRLARLKITGTLYDSLYEDAIRRRERHLESMRALPPGVTFQPDIGMDHHRPCDETKEDFLNRLAYSKSYSERWISLRRQAQENERNSKDRGQPEFHPQTGRGPLVERNKAGLPIGEFLYEHSRGKTTLAAQVQSDADQPSTPKMGDASRQLIEETIRRSYRILFDGLTAGDPEGTLNAETISLDGLDADLQDFLRPMVSYLETTGKHLDFVAFSAALDLQRQQAVTPTAHLFTKSVKTEKGGRNKADAEPAAPRIDQNSHRLAARHRSRSVPIHEQLHRERDIRDARMEERRLIAEEQELQECTFRPKLRSRSAGNLARLSPRGHGRLLSEFSRGASSNREGIMSPRPGSKGAPSMPRTPRGPGRPGGPGPISSSWHEGFVPKLPRPTTPRAAWDKAQLYTPPGPHMPAPSPGPETEVPQYASEAAQGTSESA